MKKTPTSRGHVREERLAPLDLNVFRNIIEDSDWKELSSTMTRYREFARARVIWEVNSTRQGGGVAEMLRSVVPYNRGAGIDNRWITMFGNKDFFEVTKRLHNFFHGDAGDGGDIGKKEKTTYQEVIRENAQEMAVLVRPEDTVILHDPQSAGLIEPIKKIGAKVIWRCHIGTEKTNEYFKKAWEFLGPYLMEADAHVFSRQVFIPEILKKQNTKIITPTIDPFSPKNQYMDVDTQLAILRHVGVIDGKSGADVSPTFMRQDGTPARVDHGCDVLSSGKIPDENTPIATQISRWDRLKDPIGVMEGFARYTLEDTNAHLIVAGPSVNSVLDDPEGAQVLDEVEEKWRALPHIARNRIHVVCLPMIDLEENAAIVNALQRHSAVVIQKSLQEGFGLTVAEAMWKSNCVLASAVGGIQDQIDHEENGVLVKEPSNLEEYGKALACVLHDEESRRKLGEKAYKKVVKKFLSNTSLLKFAQLILEINDA